MPNDTGKKIYEFVDAYWKKEHVPPSVMEVRNGVGLPSTAATELWLARLVTAGLLAKVNPPTPVWVRTAIRDYKDDSA